VPVLVKYRTLLVNQLQELTRRTRTQRPAG
jgi:hypothetical protein